MSERITNGGYPWAAIQRFDTNNSGRIDGEELRALRAATEALRQRNH